LGILFSPVAFVVVKIVMFWKADRIMRYLVWIYGRGWVAIAAPFVRFRREGFEKIKIKRPCIFVVNHLSFFDTYCMALFSFSDVAFMVRSWPFKMFWFAPFMRLARYLDVENMEWEELDKACGEILSKGTSLLFFPEGHRSRDGQIRRFYSGAFKLAVERHVALVPLCITGTDGLLPPGRWWLRPANIRLRALPAVAPETFSGVSAHTEMRKFVKDIMTKNINEMRLH